MGHTGNGSNRVKGRLQNEVPPVNIDFATNKQRWFILLLGLRKNTVTQGRGWLKWIFSMGRTAMDPTGDVNAFSRVHRQRRARFSHRNQGKAHIKH